MTVIECRTCLALISGASIISVQANVTDENNVLQTIEEVASLKGSNDDIFSQYVCKKCFKLLKSTVIFRRLIISSYTDCKKKLTSPQGDVDKKVSNVNSSSVQFINIEDQPEIRTGFKIEKEASRMVEKTVLENNKNELKTESDDETIENDVSSKITNTDQAEVLIKAKCKTKTIRISTERGKKKAISKNTSRICSFCGKTVKGKQNYDAHMKMHSSQLPALVYICPVCPKQFSQKKYLIVHRRSHTGEKPFHCDICNKNFSQFASFYVHKRRLHDKVVQGTCSYCGKKFVDKPELDVHIKMWHTGERPYLCEFCSATFVCNRTLQRHRRELHSERKPCHKCGKMLGDYALKKHLVRHEVLEEGLKIIRKKYTCEYCKTVMNFTSRRRHLEKQHGVKLYGRGDDCKKIPIKETTESI